ncbi:GNAT family N-acetyltransferase [Nocardioides caldifontis]|uniref:GNAT family N-acetyltransferase n=1 Tax=Nocardioides caldifontis TaxID=2588938 RepID=UPI0011DF1979|nr:GNAT family protein [Nocardioides caldifontis]
MPRTLDDVAWPLRTERLAIRRGTKEDLEPTWRFRRLEEVGHWVTGFPRTLGEYRSRFEEPARLDSLLVVEHGGEVVGDLMVRIEDAWSQSEVTDLARGVQAELGWTLDPAHGGKGFATEAVRAAIGLCFEELGLRRVVAICFADNTASWRLMERVGMRREGYTVKDALHRDGRWLDGLNYAMLREEWPAARDRGVASGLGG